MQFKHMKKNITTQLQIADQIFDFFDRDQKQTNILVHYFFWNHRISKNDLLSI
ncbi:unnamed protein product [Paramecium sonneborni]|uniref:Uncharacterized protein n=1 Tax=Paramecium sonneborni TaxID=65129 RepID=A0A8S1RGK5_9CILI|nr:unnamed protein product [Paramecium sonneborni]